MKNFMLLVLFAAGVDFARCTGDGARRGAKSSEKFGFRGGDVGSFAVRPKRGFLLIFLNIKNFKK